MRRLREEEQRWREAMLLFMRVSVEYRRTELHLPDGRVASGSGQTTAVRAGGGRGGGRRGVGSEAATRRWLIGDDDQRDSMAVDWSGRYWQSERMREKEAWYRLEERQAQSSFQHGLGLLTQLYDRSFQQLLLFADDTKAHGKSQRQRNEQLRAAAACDLSQRCPSVLTAASVLCVTRAGDEECQRLRFELQEVLTALSPAAASSAASASSSPASSSEPSPSALLPPRHPSLTAYSDCPALAAVLPVLSAVLSPPSRLLSHRALPRTDAARRLLWTICCPPCTRTSGSAGRRSSSSSSELADAKDREKQREADWEERLRTERLHTWNEREQRSRAEQETQALHDTLQPHPSPSSTATAGTAKTSGRQQTQCEADDTRQHQQQRAAAGLHLSMPGDEKEPAAAAAGRGGSREAAESRRQAGVRAAISSSWTCRLLLSRRARPARLLALPVSPRSPTGGSSRIRRRSGERSSCQQCRSRTGSSCQQGVHRRLQQREAREEREGRTHWQQWQPGQ